MMSILVKSDDVRSGRQAKVRHGLLRGGTGVNGLIVLRLPSWLNCVFDLPLLSWIS